jgi:hypothetical protein
MFTVHFFKEKLSAVECVIGARIFIRLVRQIAIFLEKMMTFSKIISVKMMGFFHTVKYRRISLQNCQFERFSSYWWLLSKRLEQGL